MFAILKKELNTFFASPIGYLVIFVFLLINGFFLWIFKGDFNILNAGFADLNSFFFITPWFFVFLIPAITMRSFSDEIRLGTIEILKTKPLSSWQILLGKYFGALLLIIIALIPTLIYVFTILKLGNPVGNLDIGSTVGSYIGLLFLAGTFTSIGLFSSTLSNNQIVAFIIGAILSFFMFYGFDALAEIELLPDINIENIGMHEHFNSISRGVIDTRDIIYFLSVTSFFLFLTKINLDKKQRDMKNNKLIINIIIVIVGLITINFISNNFYKRFDLTQDHRYTLSEETKNIVLNIEDPVAIKVYLEGDFPPEFKRIQQETKQHLEELNALNENIKYRFINPKTKTKELVEKGLQPSRLSVQEDGKVSQAVIFPWALITYKNKTEKVSLLSNTTANSQEEQLQNSIENLEYEFSNALSKITSEKDKKIAVIRGNGELKDINLFSTLTKLGEYYRLAEFTLDSVISSPQETLKDLLEYDMAIIAKPTERFTEEEKFTLDQFVINGGKTMWLIDKVHAEMDSLMLSGKMLAYNRDLNLTDLLFQYGVRINFNITKDQNCNTIRLASGNIGNQTQFEDFPWLYFPMVISNNNNPISSNIDPVLLRFPSNIDTLNNGINKTVILQSSIYAKSVGTPVDVSLNEIAQKPRKESLNNGSQIFGILLEGEFRSAYADRVNPFEITNSLKNGKPNKMVIVSDGDIIANEVYRGEPIDLSKDKWTNRPYGNIDFLLNATQYLLDDSGILKLRSKNLQIHFLDKEKAFQERGFWQMINLILPLVILLVFGLLFNFIRKKKYTS